MRDVHLNLLNHCFWLSHVFGRQTQIIKFIQYSNGQDIRKLLHIAYETAYQTSTATSKVACFLHKAKKGFLCDIKDFALGVTTAEDFGHKQLWH